MIQILYPEFRDLHIHMKHHKHKANFLKPHRSRVLVFIQLYPHFFHILGISHTAYHVRNYHSNFSSIYHTRKQDYFLLQPIESYLNSHLIAIDYLVALHKALWKFFSTKPQRPSGDWGSCPQPSRSSQATRARSSADPPAGASRWSAQYLPPPLSGRMTCNRAVTNCSHPWEAAARRPREAALCPLKEASLLSQLPQIASPWHNWQGGETLLATWSGAQPAHVG